MSTGGEKRRETPDDDEDEMLPDERQAIAERLDEIDDRESHLSLEEVAENAGIEFK